LALGVLLVRGKFQWLGQEESSSGSRFMIC